MTEIKEWAKNFLVLEPEQDTDEFAIQMLQENHIAGLLVFEKRVFNGEERFYYDISGKKSLSTCISELSLSEQDIRMLLQRLQCLITELHSYFLDEKGIVLQFEYIYKAEKEYFFCYDPSAGNGDIERKLSVFAESLLGYTDHDDEFAVLLSYEFYRRIKERKSVVLTLEEVLSFSMQKEPEEMPESQKNEEMDFLTDLLEEEINSEKNFSFDVVTFAIFALLFLVSLGYLLYMYYSGENINFSKTAGSKNGLIALIFLALSLIGMAAGAMHCIDIKEKK